MLQVLSGVHINNVLLGYPIVVLSAKGDPNDRTYLFNGQWKSQWGEYDLLLHLLTLLQTC